MDSILHSSAFSSYLEKLTLHRRGMDHQCIDAESLKAKCPLDNHLDLPPASPSVSCCDPLTKLPNELFDMVVENLDLQTLTNLRAVSRQLRQTISWHPEYSALKQHSPQLIRALLSTGLAPWFSVSTIYESVLRKSRCTHCGDFGLFVYLLTCSRICNLCMARNPACHPIPIKDAKQTYNLSFKALKSDIPLLRTILGRYTGLGLHRPKRHSLVDFAAASRLARMADAGESTIDPPSRVFADSGEGNPLRYMGVVRVSFFNQEHQKEQWRLTCKACYKQERRELRHLNWKRLFTIDNFCDHVEECPGTKAALEALLEADCTGN